MHIAKSIDVDFKWVLAALVMMEWASPFAVCKGTCRAAWTEGQHVPGRMKHGPLTSSLVRLAARRFLSLFKKLT